MNLADGCSWPAESKRQNAGKHAIDVIHKNYDVLKNQVARVVLDV